MRFSLFTLAPSALLAACCCSSPQFPPVIAAARSGDTHLLERLLSGGIDPNTRAGINGWTLLLHAIHKNQQGSVRVLLAHGADVNAAGAGGATPLTMAAGYGYDRIMRILLEAGADPRLTDSRGVNALTAAVDGVPDIDRFTIGRCQTDAVRVLLTAAPDLRRRDELPGLGLLRAKLLSCREIAAMVRLRK